MLVSQGEPATSGPSRINRPACRIRSYSGVAAGATNAPTLKMGIEARLREEIPEVQEVVAL